MTTTNTLIIGGGIVGLATAYELSRQYPAQCITVLEKETGLAQHQTGRNSGVLHSGIYYKPGSLKATTCREGKVRMEAFCEQENVPFDRCGKVIVATSEDELPRLNDIYARGQANGIACEMIGPERLRELEPHCAGIQAVHVPEAGIVDYMAVCQSLARRIQEAGNRILLGTRVLELRTSDRGVVVQSSAGDFEASLVINCAGLHSDRVAKLGGGKPNAQIVPFRGEYFELTSAAQHLCRALIYPVPDPRFPFLGVHFTRMIAGGVECGPNAVLALAREGYHKTDVNLRDAWQTLTYSGFLRLARKYGRVGMGEFHRSVSKAAFVRALQKLIPEIEARHLTPAPAGVRAQEIAPDGKLVDDFAIVERPHILDVVNAPSPAATASLSVARTIVERAAAM